MTGAIRPFRRSDRDQLTALVNAHAQAVVPGVSVSVNAVLSHLEREPGEFVVDPGADLGLPTPGVYGVPEQWPHVADLLGRVGFVRGDRTELVYLADVDRLPSPAPGLEVVRTFGVAGTRFTARHDGVDVGRIEVDPNIAGTGRLAGHDGWADIGNLHVDPAHRRRGIGTRLLAEVGDWLRLARIPRLLDYATPDEPEHRAFLEHHGFLLLTRTHRDWQLPG